MQRMRYLRLRLPETVLSHVRQAQLPRICVCTVCESGCLHCMRSLFSQLSRTRCPHRTLRKGGCVMGRRLMKGNEAAVHGALMGGCTHFFGYPITPASEIAQAAAYYFTAAGRTFLQAESEVSVINMLYGAASAGARVMTASSGPGIALMGEGLSYLAGAQLPAVVIDMQRAGPGLGNIWPEQSDYNMVVKGGGHGNYRNIVLAPASAQEMFSFTKHAFSLADRYRMTVMILSDAYI